MSSHQTADTLQHSAAQQLARWARHAQAREVVSAAVSALGEQARAMPLKGALLGALRVVHPAARELRDADLLVDGISMSEAVARLGREGFRITDIPWSHGYVALEHPRHPVWIDLHTRPMPLGFSRLTREYLFDDAKADTALFGVQVFVPTMHKLALHLIANIVKDRIVYAYPHTAFDLAAVLRAGLSFDALRADLKRLSISQGGLLAVAWAFRHTQAPELAQLFATLEPDDERRAQAVAALHAMVRSDRADFFSRLKGRGSSDNLFLRGVAPLFGALSVVTWPLRSRWLRTRNRGDDAQELR